MADETISNQTINLPRIYLNLKTRLKHLFPYRETWVLLALVVVLNLHLANLNVFNLPILLPEAVRSGQWWRLATYPFVHLSWYHLLLDAGAFFLLYANLEERRLGRRASYLVICNLTSLTSAWMLAPMIASSGLCGLSGIAHGLMAISGLEMMCSRQMKWFGGISFVVILLKAIYEAFSGKVMFAFMHMGLCGEPIAVCHMGGVLGGVIGFVMFNMVDRRIHIMRAIKRKIDTA